MNPGFYAFLKAQAPLAALIDDRIYPVLIPQHLMEAPRVMDCLVWRRVGLEKQQTLCGTDSLVRGTFEFDSYSPDYDRACAIADALRDVMLDYRGLMGTVSVGPVQLDTAADAQPEPVPGLFVEAQIFTVWYRES